MAFGMHFSGPKVTTLCFEIEKLEMLLSTSFKLIKQLVDKYVVKVQIVF